MIAAVAAAVGYGFASAFVPVLPVEPYVAGTVALGAAAVPIGVAAAVGQTLGKLVIFLGSRGALRSARLRAWLTRRDGERRPSTTRRLIAWLDRPAWAIPVVFLSASVGMPPLLLVSVYAARTAIGAPMFAVACLLGRTARLVLVALAPAAILEIS